jgi:N-acetylneuraminic acid mutarotase
MKCLSSHKMRSILFGFMAIITFVVGRVNADFTWTRKADMPTARWALSTCVVNGKIYAIGGWPSEPGNRVLSILEMYDPTTGTWTRKADMPTPRCYFSTCVVNGNIYAIGGWDDSRSISSVETYDPTSDTWTKKSDMPTARCDLSTCVVGGRIYAIGGDPGNYSGLTVVEVYNPETDTWTREANMPTGRWGLCSSVVDGKIYSIGGAPNISAVNTVEEYDPSTDTWTTKASMPTARRNMGTVVLGDKIYAIGGWQSSGRTPYSVIEAYDPSTNTWVTQGDIPSLRACLSTSVVNGRIYVIGGTDRPHPCPAMSTVYELGPLLDFNGDRIVDAFDMCIMVDHWGQEYHLCDIGPTLFGDGIVDVQDLTVLAEHLFEEIFPDELIAYWKLDETEGDIAYNNISSNHGVLSGNPTWQPDSGQVAGALQFDGVDDYISTDFVLNPADGSFSVFAWIKGGAPGQVILSQTDGPGGAGEIWLGADAVEGKLMTGIRPPSGRSPTPPMIADVVIADGQWHHIGIVITEQKVRHLYVDGIRVAFDTQPVVLPPSDGDLYIGTSKNPDTGSFFSGLVDDVRIYNAALTSEEVAAMAR